MVSDPDSQESKLRDGARPDTDPDWGMEPEARWGRLVAGEDSVPVPSERGAWPRFYSSLATALRTGGPPPVNPFDAVATLRVLECARRSADNRVVVAVAE